MTKGLRNGDASARRHDSAMSPLPAEPTGSDKAHHDHNTIVRALHIASTYDADERRNRRRKPSTDETADSSHRKGLGSLTGTVGSTVNEPPVRCWWCDGMHCTTLTCRRLEYLQVAMRLDHLRRALEEGTPFKMCQFEHVDGCTVCKDLYGHYTLPDGRTIHYYLNDELNEIVRVQRSVPGPRLRA